MEILNYQTAGSLDTLLHVVSERGHVKLVQRLLNEGADPSLSNEKHRYPYNLCKSKETKEAFRLFRSEHPDRYDFDRGQVPPGISSTELEQQRASERERRRQAKKRKNEKHRSDVERQTKEMAEEQQRAAFLAMTDEEKRQLAVHHHFETNKLQQMHLGRCWQCAQIISNDPFTYYDYKFCSTACLKSHRAKSKTVVS